MSFIKREKVKGITQFEGLHGKVISIGHIWYILDMQRQGKATSLKENSIKISQEYCRYWANQGILWLKYNVKKKIIIGDKSENVSGR